MANIIDVYELDSSNNTKQIYRFGSTNRADMGKSHDNITHVDDTIHHDDSISTVKFKIFNAFCKSSDQARPLDSSILIYLRFQIIPSVE